MDLHKKSMDHYEKAINLSKKGKDPFKQLWLASKIRLLRYKKSEVVKKVSILSGDGCVSCKKQNGKIYSISEALKKMPIPNKNCSYHLHPKNKKYSFCRCIYLPEVEIS